ncbi:MAG: stage II sporulation protein D [Oscillospiraceae bacterium]
MKTYGILCFVLAISMIVTPIFSLKTELFTFENVKETFLKTPSEVVDDKEIEKAAEKDDSSVKVLSVASGTIITMEEADYLIGCVASEMPATYHEEALKAQAVAAYTNMKRMKKSPDKSLGGADISNSPDKHQGYLSNDELKLKWGDKYDIYHSKIEKAVTEVIGKIIKYENEPIIASYFALCSGKTENSETIWKGAVPYLKSVTSIGDKLSPSFSNTVSLTTEQFSEMAKKNAEIVLPENPEEWVSKDILYSDAGTVTKITIGGKELSGMDARALFSLKSPAFTLVYKDGNFIFTTLGYGHFVGMSQYGADYMARQGSTYKEILEHYYTGVTVA